MYYLRDLKSRARLAIYYAILEHNPLRPNERSSQKPQLKAMCSRLSAKDDHRNVLSRRVWGPYGRVELECISQAQPDVEENESENSN